MPAKDEMDVKGKKDKKNDRRSPREESISSAGSSAGSSGRSRHSRKAEAEQERLRRQCARDERAGAALTKTDIDNQIAASMSSQSSKMSASILASVSAGLGDIVSQTVASATSYPAAEERAAFCLNPG